MAMRLSGLMSGMDTESIVTQLVQAKRTKVDTTKKAQTKLQWKQDAWKTLNAKIVKLYNGALSNLRFQSSFMKKTTKVSNSSVVSVITGDGAMNSVQSLKVDHLAQSGYLTGGQLGDGKQGYDTDTKLRTLGMDFGAQGTIKVSVGGEEKEINISNADTIGDVVQSFRDAGLNASFDTKNQRFYLSAKDSGLDNDFSITAVDATGLKALQSLGLDYMDDATRDSYQAIVDSRDSMLQNKLNSKLNELTSERSRLQGLIGEKVDLLKEKYGQYFDDTIIYDENGNVNVNAIKDKIAKLQDEDSEAFADLDPEALAELNDLTGSLTNLSGRVNNIDKQLEVDEDGNYVLSDKTVADITAEVDEYIGTFQAALDSETFGAIKNKAEDAEIYMNGVKYTSSKNTFEINGLTLTVNATTADNETVTLTTQDDTDGIYDMIKNFLKEYNELINEMDKLYNADSAKGYEPLTDEEKEAMSETEIEEWEKKIKDSLLRRDSTLGTISTDLKQMMMSGVMVNGKMMYLSNFGIETLSYFTAGENEKNAYHINGDPDDSNTAGNANDLRAMIASDPQTVIDFFVGLSRDMYAKLTDRMARTDYSSSYTVYEDVRMKSEYDGYTSKIKELEKKLSDYEDKWYQKFAEMETAMAKMQSNASAVTALLGG